MLKWIPYSLQHYSEHSVPCQGTSNADLTNWLVRLFRRVTKCVTASQELTHVLLRHLRLAFVSATCRKVWRLYLWTVLLIHTQSVQWQWLDNEEISDLYRGESVTVEGEGVGGDTTNRKPRSFISQLPSSRFACCLALKSLNAHWPRHQRWRV